jgi:hypothetical protein
MSPVTGTIWAVAPGWNVPPTTESWYVTQDSRKISPSLTGATLPNGFSSILANVLLIDVVKSLYGEFLASPFICVNDNRIVPFREYNITVKISLREGYEYIKGFLSAKVFNILPSHDGLYAPLDSRMYEYLYTGLMSYVGDAISEINFSLTTLGSETIDGDRIDFDPRPLFNTHFIKLAPYSSPLQSGEYSAPKSDERENPSQISNSLGRFTERPFIRAMLGSLLTLVGLLFAGKGGEYLILGEGLRMRSEGFCFWGIGAICGISGLMVLVEAISDLI